MTKTIDGLTVINSQAELDAALQSDPNAMMEIGGTLDLSIRIGGSTKPHFRLRASAKLSIVAWGTSAPSIVARETSAPRIEAWETSAPSIVAWGTSAPRFSTQACIGSACMAWRWAGAWDANHGWFPNDSTDIRERTVAGKLMEHEKVVGYCGLAGNP